MMIVILFHGLDNVMLLCKIGTQGEGKLLS